MLEARILSPRGSLYFAGDSDPYDLEILWEHLRDATSETASRDVELELVVDGVDIASDVSSWIHKIEANGVLVRLVFAREPHRVEDDATGPDLTKPATGAS